MTAVARFAERRSNGLFLALAALSSIVVLRLGAGLTFFSDEWAFIEGRSLWDPASWWVPHNEHWSTIPVLVYGALLEVVGLQSYLPYLAVVYGLHVVACAALFVLVRRRVGPLIALGVSLVVLLLGSGFENLYWGFQLGFVGSTAAGLWALVLLDRPPTPRRRLTVMLLLLVGLASSGIGLTFLVIVGLAMLGRGAWRVNWGTLGIPVALYVLWFVIVGRYSVGVHRAPGSIDTIVAVPEFIVGGFANAMGAILGIGPSLGAGAAAALLVIATWTITRHRDRTPVLAIACAVGLALQYALIAAARAGVTEGQVNYSRYTYVGAFLLLVALADLATLLEMPRPRWARLTVAALFVVSLELGLLWNARLLIEGRVLFADRAMATRALVTVALDPRYSGQVADERSLVLVPAPRSLREIVARRGSPLNDSLTPWAVPPISPAAIAAALERATQIR